MRSWISISIAFFVYLALVALLAPRSGSRARLPAIACSAAGLALCAVAHLSAPSVLLHQWLLPPALLLLGYWTSGLLFAAPMAHLERVLCAVDRAVNVDGAIRATPGWLRELLELAYAGVYVLVPVALIIQLAATDRPDADRFWAIVLATDFVCFGFLPWMQTRPPRSLAGARAWQSRTRGFNLQLLSKASIQANTFPSGHAAEAAAAALLVAGAPWPIVAGVAVVALLVSAGAVLGRYHYAADAIAGWVVAVVVWAVLI